MYNKLSKLNKKNLKKSKTLLKGGASSEIKVRPSTSKFTYKERFDVSLAICRSGIQNAIKFNENFTAEQKNNLTEIVGVLISIHVNKDLNKMFYDDEILKKDLKEIEKLIENYGIKNKNNNDFNFSIIESLKTKIFEYIDEKSNIIKAQILSMENEIKSAKKNTNTHPPTETKSVRRRILPSIPPIPLSLKKKHRILPPVPPNRIRLSNPKREASISSSLGESSSSSASAARASSLGESSSRASSSRRNVNSILNLRFNKFKSYESGGGGDCLFYSIFDSLKYLSIFINIQNPELSFDILKSFNKCLNINIFDEIDLYDNDKERVLSFKYNFMTRIRDILAFELENNILLNMSKKDNPNNNEQAKLSTLYNLILNSDDSYRDILENTFNEILIDAPTLEKFIDIYSNEDIFNYSLAELTRRQGIFANEIHIKILNHLLSECKINNTNFILKIEYLNEKKIKGITKIITDNYKNDIITIPIKHLDFGHFQSIVLDLRD
jgi:hypothetical protein